MFIYPRCLGTFKKVGLKDLCNNCNHLEFLWWYGIFSNLFSHRFSGRFYMWSKRSNPAFQWSQIYILLSYIYSFELLCVIAWEVLFFSFFFCFFLSLNFNGRNSILKMKGEKGKGVVRRETREALKPVDDRLFKFDDC